MRLREILLLSLLAAGLTLPFAGLPVHLDDANFLVLAEGAARDPWRPHAVAINWQGVTEPAFAVLSNPPGMGWWLAPVREAPLPLRHLVVMAWMAPALWGAWRLGRRFAGDGPAAALLLLSSPAVVLASHTLMPDLPLLGLALMGTAGFVDAVDRGRGGRAAAWAAVAGASALFRYSGLCLVPLLLLYGALHGRRARAGVLPALAASAAPALLFLHDLHAYGSVHFLAMGRFQAVSSTPWEVTRKGVAALAMLGGAGFLPVLALGTRRTVALAAGLVAGGLLGLAGALGSGFAAGPLAVTVSMAAAGGGALAGVLVRAGDRADRDFLAGWVLGGLAFLLALRFMALRYWLPFLPAVLLGWLRLRPGRGWVLATAALQVLVAVGMAVDDAALARAHGALAAQVDRAAVAVGGDHPRRFAGHWGWQHALEARGWVPLEEDSRPPAGSLLAVAEAPWPQEPAPGTCLEPLGAWEVADTWPGPRVHTGPGRANAHAYMVAGRPPVETYAPWTWGSGLRDRAVLYRVCGD